MKIGLLLISDSFAGTEHVVYYLAKYLIKLGIEVNLLINEEIVEHYSNIKKIKIYNLGKLSIKNRLSNRYSLLRIRKNLERLLRENKFDLICLHLEASMIIYSALSDKFKIPIMVTLHGSELENFYSKGLRYRIFTKPQINLIFKKSKIITSVSRWQAKNLKKEYKKKICIIPNGVDTEKFKPLNIKEKRHIVLFVGRFIDIKGIRELVGVAKELPQYEFWFAGQGPLDKLINSPNTKNFGFKNRDELVELYNKATICVFPSCREGFPTVGLEAMACGKPIIATKRGFSEYIEDRKDGLIIPTKNEKALKNAIIKLIEDEVLRDKLEKNARKKALKYNWKKITKKYYRLYQEVIDKSKKSIGVCT